MNIKNIILSLGMSLCLCSTPAFANSVQMHQNDFLITLGHEIITDKSNNVLVPLREVCENLGYSISWNGELHYIRLKKDFQDILLDLKTNEVFINNNVNGKNISCSIKAGRTYLPVNELNSMLNEHVSFDKAKNSLSVRSTGLGYNYFHKEAEIETPDSVTNGKRIFIHTPQICNPLKIESIDKINIFFQNFTNEHLANPDPDINVSTKIFCTFGYNQNDIVSVCLNEQKNDVDFAKYCYTFNILTGEQLDITDILKVSRDKFINVITSDVAKKFNLDNVSAKNKLTNFNWYICNQDFVLFFENDEFRIPLKRINYMLKNDLCNFHDSIEEDFVNSRLKRILKDSESTFTNLSNRKFSLCDKTSFLDYKFSSNPIECYVFKMDKAVDSFEYLIISRDCQYFYLSPAHEKLYMFHEKHIPYITPFDMYNAIASRTSGNFFLDLSDTETDNFGNVCVDIIIHNSSNFTTKTQVFVNATDDLSYLSDSLICNVCKRNSHNSIILVPHINLKSSDATVINNKIESIFRDSPTDVVYFSNVHDNILSLAIVTDSQHPLTYNFDISTGKYLFNAALLQYKNLSTDEFLDKLYSAIKNQFLSKNCIPKEDADYYIEKYNEKILSYCSTSVRMFLNDANELIVYTRVPCANTNPFYKEGDVITELNLTNIDEVVLKNRSKYEGEYKLVMPCEFLKHFTANNIANQVTLSIKNNGFGDWTFKIGDNICKFITYESIDSETGDNILETRICDISYPSNSKEYNRFFSFFCNKKTCNISLSPQQGVTHLLVSNGEYTFHFIKQ